MTNVPASWVVGRITPETITTTLRIQTHERCLVCGSAVRTMIFRGRGICGQRCEEARDAGQGNEQALPAR